MNRWRQLFLLGLMIGLMLAGGTITAQDGTKVLRFAAGPGDPRSIDPQQAIDTRDWYLLNVMFPALTTLDEESGQIESGIVTGWEVSDDGLVYTFHIIQDVPWVRYNADTESVEQVLDANGEPRLLTAHDVVYGWMRALDPATGSFASFMLAPLIEGAQAFNSGEGGAESVGIRAVDDFTFEITAPQSVGYALNLYGLINARPTPEWAIAESGDQWTESENINTYGPFALKEWVHDESMTFIKNPFWPGSDGYGVAKLDELVMRFLDAGVALREYEAGNLDVVNVPSDQLARVRADSVLSSELTVTAGACTGAWGFHTQKAPFDNIHVRRAFSYAVDRQSLVDNVLQGGALPSRWFTPPSVNNAPSAEDTETGISFDAAKAQEELQLGLDELGLSSAADLPSVTAVFGNSETNNAIGQALQIMWEDTLGVRVELNPMDTTTYWSQMAEDAGQIHAAGWCPDYNDANNYTRDVMRSDGIYNYGRWNSPDFDRMVDEAQVLPDPAQRQGLYRQIEQLMVVEEAAIIPLTWASVNSLSKPYVERTFVPSGVEAFWKWDISAD